MNDKTFEDLGIHLPYNRGAGEVRTICPKCSHTRQPRNQKIKCLSVNVGAGTFFCHHCLKSGSLVTGWSDDENRPMGLSRRERQRTFEHPSPLPPEPIDQIWKGVVEWFEKRGISEDTLGIAGVTAATEFCGQCESDVGRILFPYWMNGEHVNTKHRCGKKHFAMEKGAKRILYNYDGALEAMKGQEEPTLYIVEGEIDALSFIEAGFLNVVSVPDGAPAPDATNYNSKFEFLESAEPLINSAHKVILATDADEPGRKLMNELVRRIGPEKCSRVIWDEAHKDANECLVEMGSAYLKAVIESAEPFPVEGIFTGLDLMTDLISLYDNGFDRGSGFGFPHLDSIYRVKTGQITIATGIPNHGKSAVMDALFVEKAEREAWRFAIFSPEQQPLMMHQRNLIEIYTRQPFSEGPTERMTKSEMLAANRWVSEHFSFILPETPDIDTILSLAKLQVYRNGVKGVVIDPFNEIEHARPQHLSMTEYVGEVLRKLKKFAREQDVHVWVIAHPTKLPRPKNPGDPEPIPGLWDISDSAHWRNKADIGITVWRDLRYNERNEVHILVTKMRWKPDQGDIGRVVFKYNPINKRITELGPYNEDIHG